MKEEKEKPNPPCGNCHADHKGKTLCRKEDLFFNPVKMKKTIKVWALFNRFTEHQIHTDVVRYSTRSNAVRHIKNCVICFKYESAIPCEITFKK